ASGRTAPPAPRTPMMPGAPAPPAPRNQAGPVVMLRQHGGQQQQPDSAPASRPHVPAPGVPQTARPTAPAAVAARSPAAAPQPGMPVLRNPAPAPAPSMPPVRSATPSAAPAAPTLRNAPATPRPVVTAETPQTANRARPLAPGVGSAQPQSAPATSVPRPQPPPESRTAGFSAQSGARGHAASLAHGMPAAEPGGLADGMSAPRSYAMESHLPAMEAVGTEQSKYYPGKVVDATAGTHYDSASGRAVDSSRSQREADIQFDWDPAVSMPTLVARYLFAFAGVVCLTALIAHAYRGYYPIILLAAMFVAGLLLPVMYVVPKQRDDSDDVWVFAGLIMIFGPAIGLIVYSVIGVLKQSVNPAVVGCFAVSIVLQLTVFLAASPTLLLLGPPWVQTGFDLTTLFVNWSAVASLVGWASANIFHAFDE
ncbi:MAG TPA: hypothetical protein VKT77_10275, partial [Chthonomonadaceae bacterium]|nr:hypothetical protein [Chthonomonadaceae bacterium]